MKNATKVFEEGYIAGYNQCRVDKKEITQQEADRVLRKVKEDKTKEKPL